MAVLAFAFVANYLAQHHMAMALTETGSLYPFLSPVLRIGVSLPGATPANALFGNLQASAARDGMIPFAGCHTTAQHGALIRPESIAAARR